jgi:hypothetical protein
MRLSRDRCCYNSATGTVSDLDHQYFHTENDNGEVRPIRRLICRHPPGIVTDETTETTHYCLSECRRGGADERGKANILRLRTLSRRPAISPTSTAAWRNHGTTTPMVQPTSTSVFPAMPADAEKFDVQKASLATDARLRDSSVQETLRARKEGPRKDLGR